MQRDNDRVPAGDDVAVGRDGAGGEPGTGGRDSGSDGAPASAVELCRLFAGRFPTGERAYRIKCNGVTAYAFGKSKGQAALAVCEVDRVTDKELTLAAFEAMGVK